LLEAVSPQAWPALCAVYQHHLYRAVKAAFPVGHPTRTANAPTPLDDGGGDRPPDDPVIRADTMVHVAANTVLALCGYDAPTDEVRRDGMHPHRLAALTPDDYGVCFAVAADLVDSWRPLDLPEW